MYSRAREAPADQKLYWGAAPLYFCMYELLLIGLMGLLMANRGRGRGRRRYTLRAVNVTPALAVTNLGAGIVVTTGLTGTSDAQYRLVTAQLTWLIDGMTAGEGPVTVGFAHNDYSVTEIKEALESASSISPGDKVAQERNNRLVRKVGVLSAESPELNDGQPIKTRLNWAMQIGSAVNLFVYNDSGVQLTTGGTINTMGTLWVKDY